MLSKRRPLLAALALSSLACGLSPAHAEPAVSPASAPLSSPADVDTQITHKVVLEVGIAETALKRAEDRTMGDKSILPAAAPVGRLTLGLYGNSAPGTVSTFLRMVHEGMLDSTLFARVLPGEYLVAGRQGSRRLGDVETPRGMDLPPNPDLTSSSAFRLKHSRPGTLSLNLVDNDEDPQVKARPNYRPLEFLITTGPGPVPKLDGGNIVFGRVLDGFNVINTVTAVPTFQPMERTRAFNTFASAIGDDRAAVVRRKYGRPLKAVVILHAAEVAL